MKKLLNAAAMLLGLGLVLTGCASGGSSKGPTSVHPRSYTFDVFDGGETLNLVFNQYGPNYQVTPYFTSFVKKDKPKAGDTVTFKMKATSDVDLPLLLVYPGSTSPSWTNLCDESIVFAENVVAGEPFECEATIVLTHDMGGDFILCMQYDNTDQEVKTGGPCKLTLERVCESTDTTKEVPATPHVSEVTVDLSKYAAFCQIETNHPWENGVQNMAVIANYQTTPEVTKAYGDDFPQPGDTLHVVWKAVSDIDIERIYCRPVDCSSAANWWKELTDPDWEAQDETMTLVENVQAGVPFEASMDIVYTQAPVAQVNLCLWYEVGQGDGPAILKLVRE